MEFNLQQWELNEGSWVGMKYPQLDVLTSSGWEASVAPRSTLPNHHFLNLNLLELWDSTLVIMNFHL